MPKYPWTKSINSNEYEVTDRYLANEIQTAKKQIMVNPGVIIIQGYKTETFN